MTDSLPAVGATIDYAVAGVCIGSITRLAETAFLSVTPAGTRTRSRRFRTPRSTRLALTGYRSAENFLRRRAGVEQLPRKCAACGVDMKTKATYCSDDCAYGSAGRGRSAATAAEAAFASLSRDEIVARAQAAAASRPHHEPKGERIRTAELQHYLYTDDAHKLKDARLKADALIRRRGGRVPPAPGFDAYFAAYLESRQEMMER